MRKSLLFVIGAAISASACFALTDDVGALHGPTTTTSSEASVDAEPKDATPRANDDLLLSFVGMYQHVNQLFDFAVVDSANRVQTRGIVLPLKMKDGRFKISIPQAIPDRNGIHRVDFWADQNTNGKYDFDHDWELDGGYALLDHSWRVILDEKAPVDPYRIVTHVSGSYNVVFTHHLDFQDINEVPDRALPKRPPTDTGVPAIIHIDNLAQGKLVQIRVADPSTFGHVVGLYRFRSDTQKDFMIPGCVEPGNPYDVDLYVDANDNNDANGNGYDDPSKGAGGDLGWRRFGTVADPTGLHVTFDASDRTTGNVDVGPP